MKMGWKFSLLAALALGVLALTTPASAVEESLCIPDRACFLDCVQDLNECRLVAQKRSAECLRTNCAELRAAREAACAAGRSPACYAAQLALNACLKECRAHYSAALEECVKHSIACVVGCTAEATTLE